MSLIAPHLLDAARSWLNAGIFTTKAVNQIVKVFD
jgi:hypothetical protein